MFKALPIQLVQEEDSDDLIQRSILDQEIRSKNPEDLPGELSILPIKNTVLFPGVVAPITVGRTEIYPTKLVKKAYRERQSNLTPESRSIEKFSGGRTQVWRIFIVPVPLRASLKCWSFPIG